MLGTVGAASLAPVLLKAGDARKAAMADSRMPAARAVLAADLAVGAVQQGTALRSADITGGELHGALSGSVQGGRIEWRPRPDGSCEMSVRFHVLGPDSLPVEIHERAILAAGADLQGCWAASASAESLAGDAPVPAAALLIGRVDTTRLQQGVVKLLAFEVA